MAELTFLPLAVSASSPSLARDWLASHLAADGVDGATCDSALLVVSELVTNAVVHGRPPIRLQVEVRPAVILIEVADGRSPVVPLASDDADDDATSGRGLFLIDAVADRWGETPGLADGKTVWAEIRCPPR